ncbi:MAG TPA: acyl-CoA dehydrogenase family protein [Conexibacter sp.]
MLTSFSDPGVERFRGQVREWLSDAIPQSWRDGADTMSEHERNTERRAWDRKLWADGYAGLSWPKEHGGQGLGPLEQLVFYEEMAIAHAPDELDRIGKFLTGPAVIAHGTEAQRERFLKPILAGEELWGEGFSEPGAGSDLAALSCRAERQGEDEYVIHGQKTWTTNADLSDRIYLLARTSDTLPRGHNLTVFLMDMHQPGIDVVPIRQITGETHFSEVFFDGAIAQREDILGEEHEGWGLGKLTGFRAERHVVDALVHYREMREWADRLEECHCEVDRDPGGLRHFETQIELLRWHVMRATELMATGGDWYPPVSITKVYWSELMQRLTEAGVALDCPVHRDYWRHRYLESRASTIYGGTIQIQRNVVADRVLALPR